MKKEQVIEACKNKEWKKIDRILKSNSQTHAYCILASAVVEVYHEDQSYKKVAGLAQWKNLLHATRGPFMCAMRINLCDLHEAYQIAHYVDETGKVAQAILAFVVQNKLKLYKILREDWDPAYKSRLCGDFGINDTDINFYSNLCRPERLFQPAKPIVARADDNLAKAYGNHKN